MRTAQGFLLPEKSIESVEAYISAGGGVAINKALTMSRAQIIAEVKKSGLRGRGGGGFPTGMTEAQRQHRWRVILAFGLVYLFWGSTYLGIAIAVESIPPALMCGTRFLIAGTLMSALMTFMPGLHRSSNSSR